MKQVLAKQNLTVKKSTIHGYGVFAETNINKGEVIEECHLISFYSKDIPEIRDYVFGMNELDALPLGYGAIYNHANNPNAYYFIDDANKLLCFIAQRPILKGEEIFVSYGDTWFAKRNLKAKKLSLWRKMLPLTKVVVRFLIVIGFLALSLSLLKLLLPPSL